MLSSESPVVDAVVVVVVDVDVVAGCLVDVE